jgi:putative ABC transport system permease protein
LRFADILTLALSTLAQQKVRSALTTLGVVVATLALTLSIALSRGLNDNVLREFTRYDQFRQIAVWPNSRAGEADIPPSELQIEGAMSDAKRERIRTGLIHRWNATHPLQSSKALTRDRLKTLRALEHVERVFPVFRETCGVLFEGRRAERARFMPTADTKYLRRRLVAGKFLCSENGHGALLSELLLYEWGIRSEEEVRGVLGKKFTLQYWRGGQTNPRAFLPGAMLALPLEEDAAIARVMQHLPAALDKLDLPDPERTLLRKVLQSIPVKSRTAHQLLFTGEFTITGVLGEPPIDEFDPEVITGSTTWNADVFLPMNTAEEIFWLSPNNVVNGLQRVLVKADSNDQVNEVAGKIRDLSLREYSLVTLYEEIRRSVILIGLAIAGVACLALLVAALAITNTVMTSVLERTRVIGIMKAVGARNSHIQLIFLVEGALLGILGGALGLLLSWLASYAGDAIVRSVIARLLAERRVSRLFAETLFVFPFWLMLGIPLFAGLVTTLAALYPARRAAKLNPVASLRHE